MKSLLKIYLLAFCLSFSAPAIAGNLSLTEAKSSGLIGEREDGLVGAVLPNASGEVMDLVNTTNTGRMHVYKETAIKQNIPLNEVRSIAAQKIISMTSSGEYIFSGGQWTQKK